MKKNVVKGIVLAIIVAMIFVVLVMATDFITAIKVVVSLSVVLPAGLLTMVAITDKMRVRNVGCILFASIISFIASMNIVLIFYL